MSFKSRRVDAHLPGVVARVLDLTPRRPLRSVEHLPAGAQLVSDPATSTVLGRVRTRAYAGRQDGKPQHAEEPPRAKARAGEDLRYLRRFAMNRSEAAY